jgi:long-chain fatty acid transport protein
MRIEAGLVKWARLWLMPALLGLLALPAAANPFDVYGLGARSSAMGNVGAAIADDYTATYYNPAGLSQAQPAFNVGLQLTYDDVSIRLKDRPDGYDLPDLGSKSPAIPTKYRLTARGDTHDIPGTYQLQLGGVMAPWIDALRLGFAVGLPLNGLGEQTAHFSDEREQYFSNRLDFELLGHRQQQLSVLFGAGFKVTDWLAVGMGVSLLPNSGTTAQVYLADSGHQNQIQMAVNNQQKWNPTLHAGLTLTPSQKLQFGLVWRGQNSFNLDIHNDLQIKGFQGTSSGFPVQQDAHFVMNYTPHQFVAGVAVKTDSLLATLDATRSLWSNYVDTVGEKPGNFNDTWSARLGGQWQATEMTQLYMGLRYEQTPVPDQTGRTNYVDNDRLGVSGGARHRFSVGERKIDIGWSISVQRLLARDTTKGQGPFGDCAKSGVKSICDEVPDNSIDPVTGKSVPQAQGLQTGNPGFPGFLSYGTILAVGLDMRIPF